jgi:hypothetical protein
MYSQEVKEIITVGAAILTIGSMCYASYLKGRLKSVRPLIDTMQNVQSIIVVICLMPSFPLYGKKKRTQRTFATYSTSQGYRDKFRIAVAHRKRDNRSGASFDLQRTFQFHVHFGRVSVYITWNPLVIFENVHEFWGRNVKKQSKGGF